MTVPASKALCPELAVTDARSKRLALLPFCRLSHRDLESFPDGCARARGKRLQATSTPFYARRKLTDFILIFVQEVTACFWLWGPSTLTSSARRSSQLQRLVRTQNSRALASMVS